MADEAIKHDCSCELCRPNFWLGAFDEALDQKTVTKTDDRLEELHRQKIAAARREREALVTG